MNILVVVTGPTASGKTELSTQLASALQCDVISADSRQFYRGMSIGTAAPTEEQLKKVRHHFAGFLDPGEYYSASMFERDAISLLPSLFEKNPCVILSGGSGLYINAVCYGIDDIPDVDTEIREKYIRKLRDEGIESLRSELRIVDPDHYNRVDLKNPRRLLRALEIFATTGKPYSAFLTRQKQKRDFRTVLTGIMPPRDELYSRIDRRVDEMMAAGLEDEAYGLLPLRHANALQTVGYRELFEYFDGRISKEEAVGLIKRNTRRYARRQITWWSGNSDIKWFGTADPSPVLDYLRNEAGIFVH
ncbi:MAG: tRNA (adenosine(37)-N6)-dimethylallyltransferase MiaA [Bacteroidetes bacterium]|nr:tRNA (adenosine(37)-N6)-dimethylallyltransferase MiaA [Bacteroidota bacterium]